MLQKVKNLVIIAVTALTFSAPALVPTIVSADIQGALCAGANTAAGSNTNTDFNQSGADKCNNNAGTTNISNLAAHIVNILSVIVGVVAVIMIIIGGFRYITSGGASDKVGSAKNTLIYAIIGLIIVALAQFIVHFVLNNATNGANSLNG